MSHVVYELTVIYISISVLQYTPPVFHIVPNRSDIHVPVRVPYLAAAVHHAVNYITSVSCRVLEHELSIVSAKAADSGVDRH
jgi:hypothetical protein